MTYLIYNFSLKDKVQFGEIRDNLMRIFGETSIVTHRQRAQT